MQDTPPPPPSRPKASGFYNWQMRRRLFVWQVLAALALAAMVLISLGREGVLAQDHVARLTIEGTIAWDPQLNEKLHNIAHDDRIKGVLVRINSPGGGVTASETLFISLRRLAAKKPVVAVMDDVAASGGYIAALGTDHVIARRNTITGSIGVIFLWFQVTDLMDKVGLKSYTLRSGDLKARPNPFETPDEKVLEANQELIDDSFDWFVDLTANRRSLDRKTVLALADGRVFTGKQALANALVDQLGGEPEARLWMETKGVSSSLEVKDVKWGDDDPFNTLFGENGVWRGLFNLGLAALTGAPPEKPVGGLMAIWQPGL